MLFACMRFTLQGGNLTEEYALTFQMLSIYLLLKDTQHKTLYMFIHGVNAGFVLMLRANMVMMWGAIALLSGYELLNEKNYAGFMKNLAAGVLGILAGVLPVVIYAAMTNSASEAIFAMFTYNLRYIDDGRSLLLRIAGAVLNWREGILTVPVLISSAIVVRRKNLRIGIYYFAMLLMSIICVGLSGRNYRHYYLYLVPFVMPGAYKAALQIMQKLKYKQAVILIAFISLMFCWRPYNSLRPLLGLDHINMKPFIEQNNKYYSENEKVLVTGNVVEFYNRLGIIPHKKYFYIPAGGYEKFPDPADSQVDSIISGENDVIIANTYFAQSGRAGEIKEALAKFYVLLYHDEKNNIALYGRKDFTRP